MRVISQLRGNEYGKSAFFIGVSIEEYFEQLKPLFDSIGEKRGRDMFDVDEHIERIKSLKNDDTYLEEQRLWVAETYGCSDADDLYAVIDKDLTDGFVAVRVYPVAGMQMDPWERYPETIISSIEELKTLPMIEYDKMQNQNRNTPEYFRGCLIGGAIGDALGYGVEFSSYSSIVKKYGKEGITKYDIAKGEKARISDDTQMTLFTANGMLIALTRAKADPFTYCFYTYKDWLKTQGYKTEFDHKYTWLLDVPELHARRAPGNTCLTALQSKEMSTIENPLNTSKGCGAVMRIAPFGLAYGKYETENPQMYWDQAASIGALTHGHHMSHLSCALLTSIIGRIIYGNYSDLKKLITDLITQMRKEIRGYKHKEEFCDLMDKAVALSENSHSDVENIHSLGAGWIAEEALAIAIYCACKYQDDPIKGIIAAVNHSGDSDSTGAIAGNILGAWNGISAFDEYWINNLEIKDVIIDMANDMKYIVANVAHQSICYDEFVEYRRTMNCHPVEMDQEI